MDERVRILPVSAVVVQRAINVTIILASLYICIEILVLLTKSTASLQIFHFVHLGLAIALIDTGIPTTRTLYVAQQSTDANPSRTLFAVCNILLGLFLITLSVSHFTLPSQGTGRMLLYFGTGILHIPYGVWIGSRRVG